MIFAFWTALTWAISCRTSATEEVVGSIDHEQYHLKSNYTCSTHSWRNLEMPELRIGIRKIWSQTPHGEYIHKEIEHSRSFLLLWNTRRLVPALQGLKIYFLHKAIDGPNGPFLEFRKIEVKPQMGNTFINTHERAENDKYCTHNLKVLLKHF